MISMSNSLIFTDPSMDDFKGNGFNDETIDPNSPALQRMLSHIDRLLNIAKTDADILADKNEISMLYLRAAWINCSIGRFELAKSQAQSALAANKTALAYYRLGCAMYCLYEFDLALDSFLKALKKDPASTHISNAIQVVMKRCRSRKDRPTIIEKLHFKNTVESDSMNQSVHLELLERNSFSSKLSLIPKYS